MNEEAPAPPPDTCSARYAGVLQEVRDFVRASGRNTVHVRLPVKAVVFLPDADPIPPDDSNVFVLNRHRAYTWRSGELVVWDVWKDRDGEFVSGPARRA